MASMFRRSNAAKITPLFREVFGEIAAADANQLMCVAIAVAADECGMTDFDAEAIAARLLTLAEAAEAKTKFNPNAPAVPTSKGGGFGYAYTKWLGKLTTEQLCLWLADYDVNKARILYCDTDIDDLSVLVDLKSGHEWQLIRTQFEACIIGFGGKVEGQGDDNVHEVDMRNPESVNDMISQMHSLGF